MARFDDTIRCDGCGAEIELSPVLADGYEYCCLDCSQGFKCQCGQKMEMEEPREGRSESSGTSDFGSY